MGRCSAVLIRPFNGQSINRFGYHNPLNEQAAGSDPCANALGTSSRFYYRFSDHTVTR